MLVLFETPAGFALFKVLDEGKISKSSGDIHKYFATPENASKVVSLKKFYKFEDTLAALDAATALAENSVPDSLSTFLTNNIIKEKLSDQLYVADHKFGNAIKESLNIKVVCNETSQELIRGIRTQINSLVTGLKEKDMNAMSIGLSHSYSRYKLKFSPDKVDTMIVHAISLLDELNTELNIYGMRAREWYGWHFPELAKIFSGQEQDSTNYTRCVKIMGNRKNAATTDFSAIVPDEIAEQIREAAQISMGTDISEEDLDHINALCDQYISIDEYRTQLAEYLKNRMNAIAPNLTILVGEIVGARLICKAGSLMNLAKYPASTIQILGAEKALFRAIKSKNNTPKYGLIYNAKLVGDATLKNKGKMSRVLAAKAALSARFDALCEVSDNSYGISYKAKVEQRAIDIENGIVRRSSNKKPAKQQTKYDHSKSSATLQTRNAEYNNKKESNIKEESAKDEEMEDVKEEKKEKKDKKKDKEEKEEKKEKKDKKKDKEEKEDKKEKKSKKEDKEDKEEKKEKKSKKEDKEEKKEKKSKKEDKEDKKEKKSKKEDKEDKKEKKSKKEDKEDKKEKKEKKSEKRSRDEDSEEKVTKKNKK